MRRLKVIRYRWHSHRLVTLCDVESSQRSRLSLFTELGHFITDISRHLIEPESVSVLSDGKLFHYEPQGRFSCTHQGSLISMEIPTNWTQVTTRR